MDVAAPQPAAEGRGRRLLRIAALLAAILLGVLLLQAWGVDFWGWLQNLWDHMNDISFGRIVAGCALQTVSTLGASTAWYFILKVAYPQSGITYPAVLTTYAIGVGLNGVLPASLGTVVMLVMYLAIVQGSTFPGILAGYLVHKIFYTVVGAAVYLYLFLSVAGSFELELGFFDDRPVLTVLIIATAAFLAVLVVRLIWQKLRGIWEEAKEGGKILSRPWYFVTHVLVPEAIGYSAKLGVIAVFLGAYGIPVTLHTVLSIVGGNSISSTVSATPGGAGVNQAVNVAALRDVTDSTTANAYSVTQQLVTTAWNLTFALILMIIVFGWVGGSTLVRSSYADAKAKKDELRGKKQEGDAAADAE
jgi:uncharacterized membrane protein YbhN (UPF0104 family)